MVGSANVEPPTRLVIKALDEHSAKFKAFEQGAQQVISCEVVTLPDSLSLDVLNLDDECTVATWIATFGTMRGRRLANRLGLKGKGSARSASDLANYAWNKHTAIACRKEGTIQAALQYEAICDRIHKGLPAALRW